MATKDVRDRDRGAGYQWRAAFPGASPRNRPRLTYLAAMLQRHWGLSMLGTIRGALIVEGPDHRWWSVADNGGELNVEPINAREPTRSVPYECGLTTVPIGRVAWFVAMVITGAEITDYGPNPAVDDLTDSPIGGKS